MYVPGSPAFLQGFVHPLPRACAWDLGVATPAKMARPKVYQPRPTKRRAAASVANPPHPTPPPVEPIDGPAPRNVPAAGGQPAGARGGGNAGARPARAARGAPKPRGAAAPAAAAGAGRSGSRAAAAPTAAAGVKRAVGGKKNGAAKPPKKAKPGAQKPAAATKSRGPPWSGHPGWHCRRGRGLIDYIYTAPDGRVTVCNRRMGGRARRGRPR